MVLIIAHRGYNAVHPENTMLSFQAAIDAGATGIELDVHLSRDGEVVVMHDGKVDRTTNGSGAIRQLSYHDYIVKLDAGRGERVPLLAEVMDICKNHDVFLNIEVKATGLVETILNLVDDRGEKNRTMISSFNHDILRAFNEVGNLSWRAALVPTSPGAFIRNVFTRLFGSKQGDMVREAIDAGANAINPFFGTCTKSFFHECKDHGLEVFPWTVDQTRRADRLVTWGASGIITNDPGKMIHNFGSSH